MCGHVEWRLAIAVRLTEPKAGLVHLTWCTSHGRDSLEGVCVSSRVVVAMAVLALPLAVGAVLAPAQARGEVLRCEGHAATIVGTGHSDTLQGTAGPDVIVGLNGRDVIDGGGGNDVFCVCFGSDIIEVVVGNGRIHGNQAVYTLSGGFGDDRL